MFPFSNVKRNQLVSKEFVVRKSFEIKADKKFN